MDDDKERYLKWNDTFVNTEVSSIYIDKFYGLSPSKFKSFIN